MCKVLICNIYNKVITLLFITKSNNLLLVVVSLGTTLNARSLT